MKLRAWLPKSCRWTSDSYFSVIAWACSSDSRLHDSCVNKGFANLKCSSLRGGTHRNSRGGLPGCNWFPKMCLLGQGVPPTAHPGACFGERKSVVKGKEVGIGGCRDSKKKTEVAV